MRRLEFAEFNLSMLGYFQLALNRYCIRHNRVYAFLGEVSAPDILVILADFLLAGRGDLLDHRGGSL